MKSYVQQYPDAAAQFQAALNGKLPDGWDGNLPVFTPDQKPVATRAASGKIINAIAGTVPWLMGGSADLAPSNNTLISASRDFQKDSYDQRNIRFGVREHAMGSILSGLALHGGIRPYGGTFLVFADYMRPAIRLAALMKLPVIYVFTHDSIAVGEDGPTHQPVEHVASLRIIPGLTVIRPADAAETVAAWKTAMENTSGPTPLILSRQNLPILDRARYASASNMAQGAYVLSDSATPAKLIILASGAEVHEALAAAKPLEEKGIAVRVVNMASWELFEAMPAEYRKEVLPPSVSARIAVEAGVSMGWERYVGPEGVVIGIDRFGASAPGSVMLKKFGFTPENIVQKALQILK